MEMRRLTTLVVMIVLAATATACTSHATPANSGSSPTPSPTSPPVAHCQLHGSALVAGGSRDGKQCASLAWRLVHTPAFSSRSIHLIWQGNCFDSNARPISRETTESVTIAVTALEPDPLPNIGCPGTDGHLTVELSSALGARRILHARATQ
jgi:hypothetical protein